MKKGCLRAKSRAFSAVIPKGGFAPLRYVPAGTVATPFLEAFAAWPALCCAKMHGFAAASFFPDFSFTSLPFLTVCYKAFFGDLVCAALEFLWCLKTGKALSGEGYGLIRAGASIHVPRPHTKERLPAPQRRGPAAPQASRSVPAAGPCRSLKACCPRRWRS